MVTSFWGIAVMAAFTLSPIKITLVDGEAVGYATFQSHNRKAVQNRNGIFLTHIRTRNEPYTAQTWRLSRSVDGGRTFATVYEATHATNPPVIETTSNGDVYLIRADFLDGNAYLYRFPAEREYRKPIVTTIPGGAAGKYAAVLDEARGRLYFASHNNSFHVVRLDGTVEKSTTLWTGGEHAVMQYPHVDVAEDGAVHLAWTTQKHGVYLYWDIHYLAGSIGGTQWTGKGGTPLQAPIVVDDTGPAARISLEDEFESHTWLSSFVAQGGKGHFMYLAQTTPAREHYVRIDLATGKEDVRRQPRFGGQTLEIASLDGFFVKGRGAELFAVGAHGGRIVCLRSPDNGETWEDFAVSEETFNVYSLGGSRTLTDDGAIIGTFTDQSGSNADTTRESKVYFLRIQTGTGATR